MKGVYSYDPTKIVVGDLILYSDLRQLNLISLKNIFFWWSLFDTKQTNSVLSECFIPSNDLLKKCIMGKFAEFIYKHDDSLLNSLNLVQ